VIILRCDTKLKAKNAENLKWVFSDPYFIIQYKYFEQSPNPNVQYNENYCMKQALLYAAEGPYITNEDGTITKQGLWKNLPVIIVKDTSVSNITPEGVVDNTNDIDKIIGGMKKRIKTALERAPTANLYYLCRWNDNCTKNRQVEGAESIARGSSLKWSINPTATQAIMYTTKTRDMVISALLTIPAKTTLSDYLNLNISNGNLSATIFSPNIIDFDQSLATSQDDFNKLNECFPITADNTTQSNTNLIWLSILILIVILVACALVQLGPKYETK
jgi:hypothetical protein